MPAIRRRTYVLQPGAFELLAGDDPALRGGGNLQPNEPNLAAISTAAGLNSTTLIQIRSGKIGVSIWVMAALVGFLMDRQGYTREQAEKALFKLLLSPAVALKRATVTEIPHSRQTVAA